MFSNFGFSGGGLSGGGFGRAPAVDTAPLNQYVGAAPPKGALGSILDWFKSEAGADPWAGSNGTSSTQAAGVAAYQGGVWASKNCPSCNVVIQEMQTQLNRAASALGTPVQVKVDGIVGPATVGAFQTVARAAVTRGVPSGALLLAYNSAELIAKHADKARDGLRVIADKVGAGSVATTPATIPTIPGPGPGYQTSTSPLVTTTPPGADVPLPPGGPVVTAPSFFAINKKPLIIGGVILAVGIAAAVVILKTPSAAGAASAG